MDPESGTWGVVYGEGDPDVREATASRLADLPRIDVRAVERVEDVASVLDGDGRVDCVLTGSTLADGDWRDLATVVREHDVYLPIVLYADEPDARVASEATAAGVTEYLPRPFDEGALGERLRAGATEYEALHELRSRTDRYEQLMETLPLSVYFKDDEARYVDVSDKFEQDVSGVDPIGKTDADLFGDPDDPTGLEAYRDDRRVIDSGESIVGKEEHHDVDEGTVWVRSSKFPWLDDGDVRGLIGMTRNVTGQKAREEELRRKSQRLEQFASFVSHDLRNPINIAQGYLDRAIETDDETALAEVDAALDRMDNLVEDLLTTVREGNESPEWIDFRAFVQRVWTATETENASVEVEIPEGTSLAAVPGQFRQILDNLFRNVDEHAGAESTVTVGLTGTGFYVADDGPGIDPDVRETVFEFGHSRDGTGIGLTITREIAAAHGWEVSIEESDDGGARFEFANCLLRRDGDGSPEEAEVVPIDETADVGNPAQSGHADPSDDGATWTIDAGGVNLWDDEEEHFFAYGTVGDDVRIVAHVADVAPVSEFSKAGLMIRDWPGEGSPLAYVGATPEHGTEVVYRPFPSEPIETDQYVDTGGPPLWYRLDWVDNVATCYASPDAQDWTLLDSRAIVGQAPLSVGLAVCSHVADEACRAVFEEVRAVRLRHEEPDE